MQCQSVATAVALCLAVVFACVAATVCAAESRLKLSTGLDYSSGDYGGDDDIEDVYIPVTATLTTGRLGFRLTVPYLYVSAPTGTVITDAGGQFIAGTGDTETESGLGDVIGGVTLYDVVNNSELGIAVDVSAKVKFGTADADKGLGTGENDYSLQADLYKFFGPVTLLGSAGYKFRGDPSGLDLEDVWFASTGGIYKFNRAVRSGIIYSYRESAFDKGDAVQDVTGFVSLRLSDAWRVQLHGLAGLSESSPDWGTGMLLKMTF